jgi:hypothetical protein
VKKYSNQDVADIVQSEGLGYAIESYLSHNQIEDEGLAKLWQDCRAIMSEINRKLDEYVE